MAKKKRTVGISGVAAFLNSARTEEVKVESHRFKRQKIGEYGVEFRGIEVVTSHASQHYCRGLVLLRAGLQCPHCDIEVDRVA